MARIVETTTTPIEPVDVDPVTLDLIENGLRNARYEMDEVLFRTALSPGIREQHDEFPLIADPAGKMVVGQFGLSIPDFLDGFDGDIDEGDVLLTSDPYACGAAISHANDWLVVLPIFVDGRVVGWASMFGHMSDVGGKTPCSMPTDARTIFEEGVVIPPFRLYSAGALNEDALRIILNQVAGAGLEPRRPRRPRRRLPHRRRRVQEMCERFGTDTYLSALDALLQRNYDAMKTLLSMVFEEGRTLSFTDYICDDGVGYGPYELKMALTRTGDKVHPRLHRQLAAGRRADQLLHQREPDPDVLRHLHDHRGRPADPLERRLLPARRRRDPRGLATGSRSTRRRSTPATTASAASSTCSAACSARPTRPAQRRGLLLQPALHVLGQLRHGDRKGEWFQLYSIGFGGIPGRPIGDGPDGHSLWPWFVNIPCEYLESYYPLRIEKWETSPTPAAPGLHRGGNGVDVAYRFLEPGTIAIHDDRWLTYPWGVNGGAPGARGTKWLERADGTHEVLPSKMPRRRRAARATCCTSSPGAAAAGATPSSATPSWSRSRCAADWSPPRAPAGTASCSPTARVDDGGDRARCARAMRADRPAELPVFDMGPPLERDPASAPWRRPGCPAPTACRRSPR